MVSLSMLKLEAVKKISEPASWKLTAASRRAKSGTHRGAFVREVFGWDTPQPLRPVTPIMPKSVDEFSSSHRHGDFAKNKSLAQLLMLVFPCPAALDQ